MIIFSSVMKKVPILFAINTIHFSQYMCSEICISHLTYIRKCLVSLQHNEQYFSVVIN